MMSNQLFKYPYVVGLDDLVVIMVSFLVGDYKPIDNINGPFPSKILKHICIFSS
jgi:hypothetical protein